MLSHEVRRYNRAELGAKLQTAGFEIVRLTYTNAALFLPLALSRAMQRRRGLKMESERDAQHEISVPPAPVNGLLSGVMLLESAWVRWFNLPFGSSLLCLARKPDR